MKKPSILFLVSFLLVLIAGSLLFVNYAREMFVTAVVCPVGSWCPNGTTSGQFFLCPPGSYGDRQGLTTSACSGRCKAGCFCPAGSTNACPRKCPAGFYCVQGTSNDALVPPVVCPAGNYCPEGSAEPTRCPEGKYCPEGTSSL
jgi:hypothetical protein